MTALASLAFAVWCCGISPHTWCMQTPKQENLWHCAAVSDERPSGAQAQDGLPWSQNQLLTSMDLAC